MVWSRSSAASISAGPMAPRRARLPSTTQRKSESPPRPSGSCSPDAQRRSRSSSADEVATYRAATSARDEPGSDCGEHGSGGLGHDGVGAVLLGHRDELGNDPQGHLQTHPVDDRLVALLGPGCRQDREQVSRVDLGQRDPVDQGRPDNRPSLSLRHRRQLSRRGGDRGRVELDVGPGQVRRVGDDHARRRLALQLRQGGLVAVHCRDDPEYLCAA